MTGRPDPIAVRVAARQLQRAADDLEHDASLARGSAVRLEGHWAGSTWLVHAGASDVYARDVLATATALREVAHVAVGIAASLERDLAELARLEAVRAVGRNGVIEGASSSLDVRIEEVWSRIRCHQMRFAHEMATIDPRCVSRRRLRCGPVPDLGVIGPPRMRTGPVRPIGGGPRRDLLGDRDPGRMRTGPVRRLLAVHRPDLLP